jgi:hypothetical protein
MVTKIDKIELE